jgi:hypothetical protein
MWMVGLVEQAKVIAFIVVWQESGSVVAVHHMIMQSN